MSFGNGLNGSRDVYRTGDLASNEFLRVGDAISITSPLIIESATGNETLELAEGPTGQALIRNNSVLPGGGEMVIQSNQDTTVQSVLGDVVLNATLAQVKTNSAGILMTSTAGEQHNITGNFGVTATGTGSVVSNGNMVVGGQNLSLNGGGITATGYVNVNPPAQAGTNASGAITVSNGSTGTAPNTSYTFWAEGDVPNAGRTPGNLDLIRINAGGSLPLMNITPAGDLTLEPAGATLSAPEVRVTAPPAGVIAPTNTTGLSQQNLQPVLWDSTSKQFVIPSSPLIRFFRVDTPTATGNPVDIIDPQGNSYNSEQWVCAIAGFQNGSGDRTYNAVTIPYGGGAPWKCLYDTAGSDNQVWILAISTTLLGGIQY